MPGEVLKAPRRVSLHVLAALSLAAPAAAITVQPLSFADLVNTSATVAYVRVTDVRGQWAADRQSIESVVTAAVLDAFKGAPGAVLTFTTPGGRVGTYLNLLPGAPVFAPGDLVVVFLTSRGARLPITTGFTQGVYRVLADARGGAPMVTPPIIETTSPAGRIVRGDVRRRPMTVTAFAEAVRSSGHPEGSPPLAGAGR